MPQTSLVVSQGDTVRASDHNKVVADVAELYTADTAAAALLPTSDQKAALAGTSGTPSASNKYVTNADTRLPPSGTTGVGVVSGGQKIQSGKATISASSSGTVTFPSAFSAAPVVTFVFRTGNTNASNIYGIIGNSSGSGDVSTTGFPWMCNVAISGTLHWQAIGT